MTSSCCLDLPSVQDLVLDWWVQRGAKKFLHCRNCLDLGWGFGQNVNMESLLGSAYTYLDNCPYVPLLTDIQNAQNKWSHCDLSITSSVAKCVLELQKLIMTRHQELYLSKTKKVALLLQIQPQRLLLVTLFFYFHTEFVNMVTTAKNTKFKDSSYYSDSATLTFTMRIKQTYTSCEGSSLLGQDTVQLGKQFLMF